MDHVYAFGIKFIEVIQSSFEDQEWYFKLVNHIGNPQYIVDYLIPLISIVDSVFAAQLLLCMAFGGWLNTVMKWWLLEDRPYWWVRETKYYTETGTSRPELFQTYQTCETGPGSPSGHTTAATILLMLVLMWNEHIMRDRKIYHMVGLRKLVFALLGVVPLVSVMMARMFVAAHFPHQCLLGGTVGGFIGPGLCIYVTDPYIWGYRSSGSVRRYMMYHGAGAVAAIAIGFLTHWSLVASGIDPHFTVNLAIRWCRYPSSIHVSTTPIFALVQSCASLLGWALFVTPSIAQYRHYTKSRSLIISAFVTTSFMFLLNRFEKSVDKDHIVCFYLLIFFTYTIKPFIFLRLIPKLAVWPYKHRYLKAD